MEGIRGHTRHELDGYLQLVVISVKDDILQSFLVHVARVP
jgi:hypothetical protein